MSALLKFSWLIGASLWLASCSSDQQTASSSFALVADEKTKVFTEEGSVVGGIAENGARVWLGLPYARAPIGDLRWRAPQPPTPRPDSLQATEFSSVCAQFASPLGGAPESVEAGQLWGNEDCLYLNIYAPSKPVGKLPVMFWMHGGGNIVGHSGFYDGSLLAERHQLVVVTINYRLGPLGWWHHRAFSGDSLEDASGNYGTLDSIQALKWVQANIAAFAGDATRVTIFGESAGATNVASLVASPLARGLFHGAIMQSGDAGRGVTIAEASHAQDGSPPGLEASTNEILLKALMAQSADCNRACAQTQVRQMAKSQQAALLRRLDAKALLDLYGESGLATMPRLIKDGYVLPKAGLLSGFQRSSAVPMILGTNRDEPTLFMAFNPEHSVLLGGLPLWRRDAHLYDLIVEYGSAAWKLYGVDKPASLLRSAGVPVWTYRFDWDDLAGIPFLPMKAMLGAAHAFEIPFVFGRFQLGRQTALLFDEDNKADRVALSDRMMAYWAAFAYYGDPGRGLDDEGHLWSAFAPDAGIGFLHLDAGKGGIHLSEKAQPLTFDRLLAMLNQDERISGAVQKCEVAKHAFRYNMAASVYIEVKRQLGCS